MKKKSIFGSLLLLLFAAATWDSCSDDPDRPELPKLTWVRYELSVSPDMLAFYDININFLTTTEKDTTAMMAQTSGDLGGYWQYANKTMNVDYHHFKFKAVAKKKADVNLNIAKESLEFSWNFTGQCTNNTPTYTYNPANRGDYKVEKAGLEKFLEEHATIQLADWDNEKTATPKSAASQGR